MCGNKLFKPPFSQHFHLSRSARSPWKKNYISFNSSCRGFTYYQLHTCSAKASERNVTVVAGKDRLSKVLSLLPSAVVNLYKVRVSILDYFTTALCFPETQGKEQQLIHRAPVGPGAFIMQAVQINTAPSDWISCSRSSAERILSGRAISETGGFFNQSLFSGCSDHIC